MRSTNRHAAIVLAIALLGSWTLPARAQTQAPSGPSARKQTPGAAGGAARPGTNTRTKSPQYTAQRDASPAAAPRAADSSRNPAGAGGQNLVPKAPFTLTPEQEQLLDAILVKWEQQSAKVDSFKCSFTRWEIDPTFGPKQNEFTASEAKGNIKYKSPDRGEYRIDEIIRWDSSKSAYTADPNGAERWICDGEAIYEFVFPKKILKVRMLPPEMRGKAITDGPLPFIFGANAEQLKRRYMMRDVTPQKDLGKRIWLEAWPKFQQDAANFQRATVILNERTFLPEALQIFPPGIIPVEGQPQAYTAFGFQDPMVNDPLAILKRDFATPLTPPFWKRMMVDDPAAQTENPVPPAGQIPQAQRPAAESQRK